MSRKQLCFRETGTGWCLKMKIGFPNNPRKNILKEIEWIGKNGFDFVDLFLEEDLAVPEKIDINKTKKLLEKYNLDVVGHTAFYLPIGAPVKLIREASVEEAERYFRVFEKLCVKYVTIHAYWPSGLFSEEDGVQFQVETLKKLVKIAKKYNLRIMYESLDTKKDSLKNVEKIIKKVPGLYFHLDIGHTNLYGRIPVSFIRRFREKLVHIHMHDNNGEEDEHKSLGKGNINFKKIIKELKKIGYDKTITLEIFEKNKKLAVQSRKKLRKLWESL